MTQTLSCWLRVASHFILLILFFHTLLTSFSINSFDPLSILSLKNTVRRLHICNRPFLPCMNEIFIPFYKMFIQSMSRTKFIMLVSQCGFCLSSRTTSLRKQTVVFSFVKLARQQCLRLNEWQMNILFSVQNTKDQIMSWIKSAQLH